MSNRNELTPPQQELARGLATLQPARPGLDRDALMFRAGQRSIRKTHRLISAAVAVAAIGLLAAAVTFPIPPKVQRRTVYVPVSEPVGWPIAAGNFEPRLPTAQTYLQLQKAVLDRGLDALPTAQAAVVSDETTDELNILGKRRQLKPLRGLESLWEIFGKGNRT